MYLIVMGLEDWGTNSQQLGFKIQLTFSCCETLDAFLNISEPYFLHV